VRCLVSSRRSAPATALIALWALAGLPLPAGAGPCPTSVVGIDPSIANHEANLYAGPYQTFYAADTLIRSITLWRSASRDTASQGVSLSIHDTDASGTPVGSILAYSPNVSNGPGDGVHPVPFVFEFDPPWVLPRPGTYALRLFGSGPNGYSNLLATFGASVGYQGGYSGGQMWIPNYPHHWGQLRSLSSDDIVFRIVFVRPSAPGQIIPDFSSAQPCRTFLSWTGGNAGAPSATVLRRSAATDWESVGSATADGTGRIEFSDTSVVPGTRYGYSLRTDDCSFIGETSVAVPGGVTVLHSGMDARRRRVHVSWSVPARDVPSATIYRRTPVTGWLPLGRVFAGAAGRLEFEDITVAPCTRYGYRLGVPQCDRETAVGSTGWIDVPSTLGASLTSATATGCASRLTWVAADSGARTAAVYRRMDGGDWAALDTIVADLDGLLSYEDTSVAAVTRYHYRLGVDRCGVVGFDGEAAVDVPGHPAPIHLGTEAGVDRVALTWSIPEGAPRTVRVYRRSPADDWRVIAQVVADSAGRVTYEDTDVDPGDSFYYRLGVDQCGTEWVFSYVYAGVPTTSELALAGARPNPSDRGFTVAFSLVDASPARIEVLDVAGRRLLSLEVGALGPGSHTVDLARERKLPAGIYIIRLSQAGRALTTRGVAIR